MYRKIILLFLLVVSADFSASKIRTRRSISPSKNNDFVNFMISTQSLQTANPQRSMDCFDYFIPILHGVAVDFEANYMKCLSASENAHQEIESQAVSGLTMLQNMALTSCQAIDQCGSQSEVLKSFECFETAGNENVFVFNNISTSAEDQLVVYQQRYYKTQFQEDTCITASQREYVEGTACVYEELQKCFMGESSTRKCKKADTTGTEFSSTTESTLATTSSASELTEASTAPIEETDSTSTDPLVTETSTTESPVANFTEAETTTVTQTTINDTSDASTDSTTSTPAATDSTSTETSTTQKVTKRTTTPTTMRTRSTTVRKTTQPQTQRTTRSTTKNTTRATTTTKKSNNGNSTWEEIRKRWEEWLESHKNNDLEDNTF